MTAYYYSYILILGDYLEIIDFLNQNKIEYEIINNFSDLYKYKWESIFANSLSIKEKEDLFTF